MGRVPREVIDEIRDRTDLVALVERHVALQRRGTRYVGLCPFHQEKSPSFGVVPDKGIFHCFGCQTGGDCFKFLMLIEGLSFMEAVRELANAAGIRLEEEELTEEQRQAMKRRASSYDVLTAASEFFRSMLWTRPEGAKARDYVRARGLSEATAQEALLGFAPDGWTALTDHLHRQGFRQALVAEAGLARPSPRGDGHYDTFRNRLIFPIRDERGRVIGFGGRLIDGEGPKYLNSPETPLYDKSKVLFGLFEARQAIQQKRRVIVVEGYMDAIALRQAGFAEVVAPCGTALTEPHLEKLHRLAPDAIAVFDSDAAGVRAAERSLPLFLRAGIRPWRLDLGAAKDPDELIQKRGADAMGALLERPTPLFEWLVDRRVAAGGGTVGGATQLLDELVPLLRELPANARAVVAQKLHVPEQMVLERVQQAPARPEAHPPAPPPTGWRADRDVNHLLWLLVHRYDRVADLVQRAPPRLLEDHAPVIPVVARLLSGEPVAAVLQEVEDEGVRRALSAVVTRAELYEPGRAAIGAVEVIDRMSRRRRRDALDRLLAAQKEALAAGDLGAYRKVAEERKALAQLETDIDNALRTQDIASAIALLAISLPDPPG
jgi:DNA primase